MSAELDARIPQEKRAKLIQLANFVGDSPRTPEGYQKLSEMAHLKRDPDVQALLRSLKDDSTGYESQAFLGPENDLVIAIKGAEDATSQEDAFGLSHGEVPSQAYNALKTYSLARRVSKAQGWREPFAVGHSLGGALAQLYERGLNVAGPGASLLRETLQQKGAYRRYDLPERAAQIHHLGFITDPIYAMVGTDADLDFCHERGMNSPHVTGPEGRVFYLEDPNPKNPFLNNRAHSQSWAGLLSSKVVSTEDSPAHYSSAGRHTFPLFEELGACRR
jgi:hypothetical protein